MQVLFHAFIFSVPQVDTQESFNVDTSDIAIYGNGKVQIYVDLRQN